jgi:ubiquinone biosynthesis protein COQ9
LSSVYASTVLYWLGDTSPNHEATWAFLDRRIANVMEFEKFKVQVNANPLAKQLLLGPHWLLSKIKVPRQTPSVDLPGGWPSRQ